jgi:hypothetical protein
MLHSAAEHAAASRTAYLASDWHRALSAYFDERGQTSAKEELDALEGRLCEVTRTIIATPVRTPGDLVVRAAIAAHWYGEEISNPSCAADDVLAAVVRGVLDLAGLAFDSEGRLITARRNGQ